MFKYIVGRKPALPSNKYEFKMLYTFDKRKCESNRIIKKYPDKVPVIIERSDSSDISDIDKHKWLIQEDITFGQLLLTIRRRIKLDQCDAIFIFINDNYVPNNNENIGLAYNKHKDLDGFLYIAYSKEKCYGRV